MRKKNKLFILSALALAVAVSVSGCGLSNVKKPLIIKPKVYTFDGFSNCNTKAQCIKSISQDVWLMRKGVTYGVEQIEWRIKQFKDGDINYSYHREYRTFGYSKNMLRQVALNMTDTQYLQPILAFKNDLGISFRNGFRVFLAQTRNKGVLDSMVFGYFAKSLTNQFGEMKTSFLRNIGVGLVTNINYITILDDANDFLKTVSMDNNNNYVFETLFNKKFGNRRIIVTSNGPFGLYGSEAFYGRGYASTMGQIYLSYLRYPNPSLNNVNFYSLAYYLFYEIDYGNGVRKQISERLLSDIILRHFAKARQLLHNNYKLLKSNYLQSNLQKLQEPFFTLVNKFVKVAVSSTNYPYPLHTESEAKISALYIKTKKGLAILKSLRTKIDECNVNTIRKSMIKSIKSNINYAITEYKLLLGDLKGLKLVKTPSYYRKHLKMVPYI